MAAKQGKDANNVFVKLENKSSKIKHQWLVLLIFVLHVRFFFFTFSFFKYVATALWEHCQKSAKSRHMMIKSRFCHGILENRCSDRIMKEQIPGKLHFKKREWNENGRSLKFAVTQIGQYRVVAICLIIGYTRTKHTSAQSNCFSFLKVPNCK